MGKIGGSAGIEIEAPIEAVYAIAADVEGSPRWQSKIKVAECLEHSGSEQTLVHMETDAKVRTIGGDMRFSYEPPTLVAWTQEDGDVKSADGAWELEDLGDGRTAVTYRLEVDLGRVLGLALRGPIVGVLRSQLIDSMPEKLKRFAEAEAG